MTDEEFIAAFEGCTLPNEAFHHCDHIRLAWLYLRQYGFPGAAERISDSIRNFAAHNGAAQKYHHTITIAWLRMVEHASKSLPPQATFEELLVACPALIEKNTLREYYSSALLDSDAARAAFVEPDLKGLPRAQTAPCSHGSESTLRR